MLSAHRGDLYDVLSLLDDIATSEDCMGCDDIDSLSEARERLSIVLDLDHNDETDRYTDVED